MSGFLAALFGRPAIVVAAEAAVFASAERKKTAANSLSATIEELLQRNDELTGRVGRNEIHPSSGG